MNAHGASIHVAVGLVTNQRGQLLIALRPPHVYMPGFWEFPGGKLEAGETSFMALQRELKEEVGIEVLTATPLIQYPHRYPEREVFLDTWLVKEYLGEPVGRENQEIRWVFVEELQNYTFPEGNYKVIEALCSQQLQI